MAVVTEQDVMQAILCLVSLGILGLAFAWLCFLFPNGNLKREVPAYLVRGGEGPLRVGDLELGMHANVLGAPVTIIGASGGATMNGSPLVYVVANGVVRMARLDDLESEA